MFNIPIYKNQIMHVKRLWALPLTGPPCHYLPGCVDPKIYLAILFCMEATNRKIYCRDQQQLLTLLLSESTLDSESNIGRFNLKMQTRSYLRIDHLFPLDLQLALLCLPLLLFLTSPGRLLHFSSICGRCRGFAVN